jgi:hypothetical protein
MSSLGFAPASAVSWLPVCRRSWKWTPSKPTAARFAGTQQLTWDVTGGTGQFDDAIGSFTGTVSAVALLARNPDGSCSLAPLPFPLLEVDKFAESGTLSF